EALAALAQLLLGSLARGDVAEDDHAAAERPLFPAQRSSVDAQYDTLRLLFITDDYLGLIDLLAAYGSDQGQFHGRIGRDPMGQLAAEMFRPFLRGRIPRGHPDDSFGGRVPEEELAVFIRDDHSFAHAIEDRLQDRGLPAQRLLRLPALHLLPDLHLLRRLARRGVPARGGLRQRAQADGFKRRPRFGTQITRGGRLPLAAPA